MTGGEIHALKRLIDLSRISSETMTYTTESASNIFSNPFNSNIQLADTVPATIALIKRPPKSHEESFHRDRYRPAECV